MYKNSILSSGSASNGNPSAYSDENSRALLMTEESAPSSAVAHSQVTLPRGAAGTADNLSDTRWSVMVVNLKTNEEFEKVNKAI